MGLWQFFFGSREKKEPIAEPDPGWIAYREATRAREDEARRQLQINREHSAAEAQRAHIANMDAQIRHENNLMLAQRPRNSTSQIEIPAITQAILQANVKRTITRLYHRPGLRISLFEFINTCIITFARENGCWPETIHYPLKRTLPAYDQQLMDFQPEPGRYFYQFMSFQLVEDARMSNQILLKGTYHV